jgi:tetratricopeptide (TPR) repeat protein
MLPNAFAEGRDMRSPFTIACWLLLASSSFTVTVALAAEPSPEVLWQQQMSAASRAASQQDLPAAIAAYRQALDLASAFAETDPRRIRNLEELASVTQRRGLPLEALSFYETALAARLRSPESGSPATAEAMAQQAKILQPLTEYERAEALLRQALGIRETAPLVGQLAALLQLARPEDPEIDRLLERAVELDVTPASAMSLARHFAARGLHEQAIEAWGRALARAREPELPNHWMVTEILTRMAEAHEASGRTGEAEALYLQVLDSQQRRLGPEHTYVAEGLRRLGALYIAEGRYVDAERQLERAQTLKERAWGACDACGLEVRKLLAQARQGLGLEGDTCTQPEPDEPAMKSRGDEKAPEITLRERGELVRAVETAHEGVELAVQEHGAGSLEAAERLARLARLLVEQQSGREAVEAYARSLAILDENPDADPAHVAAILHGAAAAHARLRQHEEARRHYVRELEIREALGQSLTAATLLETLGHTLRALGDERTAGEYFGAAAERRRAIAGDQAPEVIRNLASLSISYLGLDMVAEAGQLLADLRARVDAAPERDADTSLTVLHAQKRLFEKTGQAESVAATQAAIDSVLRLKEPASRTR